MLGLRTVYVPLKITGDAFASLLGGDVDFLTVDATWGVTQHPHKIRILAVTSAKRAKALPEVPTLAELGFKDFDITPWWGVVVPAGTPPPIGDQLAAGVNQITARDQTPP